MHSSISSSHNPAVAINIDGNELPGYEKKLIGECSGSIAAQTIKYCTITYTDTTLTNYISALALSNKMLTGNFSVLKVNDASIATNAWVTHKLI